MRQPLWIVNSLFVLLLIIVLIFMFFARVSVPVRGNISPLAVVPSAVLHKPQINSNQIFEFDLFNTYQKALEQPKEEAEPEPVPLAPAPLDTVVPPLPAVTFVAPLDVTLKAIVTVSYDDRKNRAIILDNKTSKESAYQVGDMFQDAQLMGIFSNKVIFIRANGQQEVLYLREKDAKADPAYLAVGGWQDVVKETGMNEYTVDPVLFFDRIKTLAQFIEMLDLTTVYKKGKSIGCRVGYIERDSLGTVLGLHPGDIILRVNDIAALDKVQRAQIYRSIMAVKPGRPITIDIVRNTMPMRINVLIQEIKKQAVPAVEAAAMSVNVDMMSRETAQEKEARILREKFKFAPTVKEIRNRERKSMMERGKRMKPTIVE
jgi:type II secretory pathway component PulC